MAFEITTGIQHKPLRVLIYGVEGVGKTTLASQFPEPLFIDCEGGTDYFTDVKRLPRPSSWSILTEEVKYVIANPGKCKTLVIDTIDWAESMAIQHVCDQAKVAGIEDFGWSKGYTYLNEQIGKLLNLLNEARDAGINVVLTAHMALRTVTKPDETGAYDRYELKLKSAKNGNNSQLVKEWADLILFCNFKQFIVEDKQTQKKKAKGGTERVMYTTHTAAWDAKNRFGLPEELPMSFASIAHLFGPSATSEMAVKQIFGAENVEIVEDKAPEAPVLDPHKYSPIPYAPEEEAELAKLPKNLVDLMRSETVHSYEIQKAVSDKGYFPMGTPITNYPTDFIDGCLVGAWPQVFALIQKDRDLPF